jgi:uncharacterized protein (UPF0333 family)
MFVSVDYFRVVCNVGMNSEYTNVLKIMVHCQANLTTSLNREDFPIYRNVYKNMT